MGIPSTQRETLRVRISKTTAAVTGCFSQAISQVRTGLETKVPVFWCCSADICSLPTDTQRDCDKHRGLGPQVFLWERTGCIQLHGLFWADSVQGTTTISWIICGTLCLILINDGSLKEFLASPLSQFTCGCLCKNQLFILSAWR